jgi:hypothetical protein
MAKQTFEDYLKEKCMEEHPNVRKDNWEDVYESFLEDLQIDDFISYADQYGELREMRATPKEEV